MSAVRPSLSIASAWFVTLLLCWSSAWALAVEAPPLPPDDGILDDALLLTHEERTALIDELKKIKEEQGITPYIYTCKAGLNPSPIAYARALRKSWLTGKSGILVSLVVGKAANPSVQLTPDIWTTYSEPRVAAMLRRIGATVTAADTPQAKLSTFINGFSQNLRELAQLRREGEAEGQRELIQLAGAFLVVLLIASLIAWLMARRLRRSELNQLQTYHFPHVIVQERLGAGLGGGVVVEASWGRF